jgi:hypothetical protein
MLGTEIYLTTMGLVLAGLPVFLVKTVYKYFGLDKSYKELLYSRYSFFLLVAFVLPIVWQFFPIPVLQLRWVNFLQHAVGGGVAVSLGCVYMIHHFKEKLEFFDNRIFQLIFIFMFTSSLGVLNEILEFSLDALRIGVFAIDRYDTWFDLVANTTGALSVFVVFMFLEWPIKIYKHFRH